MRIQFCESGDSPVDHSIRTSKKCKNKDNIQTVSHEKTELESGTKSADSKLKPDTSYLCNHFKQALGSFYRTVDKIISDNPVDIENLTSLSKRAQLNELTEDQFNQLKTLKLKAQFQGRAIGATMGFFLKYSPYSMLAEVRQTGGIFQPAFGPVLITNKPLVTDVLARHNEFTVDPYGAQMRKAMSPQHNGGYDHFVLSTDDKEKFTEDKQLLKAVVNINDIEHITSLVHEQTQRRLKQALGREKSKQSNVIDVVQILARTIPVYLIHHYFGVPVTQKPGQFNLNDTMLKLYSEKVTGPDGVTPLPAHYKNKDGKLIELPQSALQREDGVIPNEQQMYNWIVDCFRHFFNNIQQDIKVQAQGVHAYRQLLVYILREIDVQRKHINDNPDSVSDNMLTRLVKIQMGLPLSIGEEPILFKADRVSDLRIAENIMGTIVGAVAGQEEATCRVIDSIIRLKDGEYNTSPAHMPPQGLRYGCFEHACELAQNIVSNTDAKDSRAQLLKYVFEGLRLQPQGEILLRQCAQDGAVIGNSRPIRKNTLIFAAHGSAMQDVEQADSFILGREENNYLHYGYGRHKCLGQHISPVLICEALVAVLNLKNLRRPSAVASQTSFPQERRFGYFQLDDDNLYAKTFSLTYDEDKCDVNHSNKVKT